MENKEELLEELETLKTKIEEIDKMTAKEDEETEEIQEDEEVLNREVEGRVVGLGVEGDFIVDPYHEKLPLTYTKRVECDWPRIGDKVMTVVTKVTGTVGFGKITEISHRSLNQAPEMKQEMFRNLLKYTTLKEDDLFYDRRGQPLGLRAEGLKKVMKIMRIYSN